MKAVILRPLAIFTVTFFIVSCLFFTADTAERLLSAVLFSVLFVLSLILHRALPPLHSDIMRSKTASAVSFFLAGALLASWISFCTFDIHVSRYEVLYDRTTTLEGTVTDVVWDGGYSAIYIVDVDNADGLSGFSCVLRGEGGVSENSVITCEATFSPLSSSDSFDGKRYYLSKGVICEAESDRIRSTGDAGFSLRHIAKRLNNTLSGVFTANMKGGEGGLAAALLLGNRESLPDTVKRDFKRLGLSHIISISGMHLAVICSFVSQFLSSFGKRAREAGTVLVVLFYMFITGLSPSVTRSGIMILFVVISSFLKRRSDSFTSLGIAVFLICITDPYSCGDIGLQLSFAAVMAILLYSQRKKREYVPPSMQVQRKRILPYRVRAVLSYLAENAVLTVIIVLFLLPLEWRYFGEISLISPLTSPIFSLLCTSLLWFLPLMLIFAGAPTTLKILAAILSAVIRFIYWLAGLLSRIPGITVSIKYPFAGFFCVIIFLGVCIFCIAQKRVRRTAGIATAAAVLVFLVLCRIYALPLHSSVHLTMVNNNKSDAILLQSDEKLMLIDVGNGHSAIYDSCNRALSESTSTEYEAILLTHIHKSHPSTLLSFFEENIVRSIILPDDGSPTFSVILDDCKNRGVKVFVYKPGDTVTFYDAVINTAPYTYVKRADHPVVSFSIDAFGERFVYLGSSFSESVPDAVLADASYVRLGVHGPVRKKSIPSELFGDSAVIAPEAAIPFLPEGTKLYDDNTVILE